MTVPTCVVIPFRNEAQMTSDLLISLREQGNYEAILLFDNGSGQEALDHLAPLLLEDPKLRMFHRPEARIYEMWNEGWSTALGEYPVVNVAILNNDIAIPAGFLQTLANVLRSSPDIWAVYPDYDRSVADGTHALGVRDTRGTYQHGGMCGWAFMLRGEAANEGLPYIDTQFEWWYGDDDLVRNVAQLGKRVCRVTGLPLDHIGEKTARNGENEWTHEAKGRDTTRFHQKWK